MPGRLRRSCDNCNTRKLRCGCQKPICDRCRRLQRPCVYSARTDRPRSSPSSALPPTIHLKPTAGRIYERDKQYFGIPSNILPSLIDLYFTHLYNAQLLFHRPSLVHALESDVVRPDVLLSICALASKFYIDPRGFPILVESGFDREWAEAASRIALREIESPSHDNIVVFLNLSLFWYSVGEFQRSAVHSACAANTAWTLGNPDQLGTESPLESEIRTRRFWACYLLCTFQTNSLFPKVPTEAMSNMRLPRSDDDFQPGNPQPGVSLKSATNTQSIYAELVRAMALWSSVLTLIKQSDLSVSSQLARIQVLDADIHKAWSRLHVCFQLDTATLATVSANRLPKLLLLHIIYHQCLCSLHSSIVPLFSWTARDNSLAYAHQLSAQTAFEHANAVSSLLEAALNLEWDSRAIPSFIGFAAYSACAIQIPFLWCAKFDIKQCAGRSILANLKTLQVLGDYWAFLKILGRYACGLYKAHANRAFTLVDEPKNTTPESLSGFNVTNSKARLSILAHNSIMTSDQGFVANGEDDIGGLGLDESEAQSSGSVEDKSITEVMAQISSEEMVASSHLSVMMDPFPSFEASGFYDSNGFTEVSTEGLYIDHAGNLEDWIREILQNEL